MDDVIRDGRNISKTQKPKILEDEQRKQEKNDKIIEDNKQEKKTMYFLKKNSKTKKNYDFFFVLHEGWMIVFSD
jgi:hypothetical protein